MPASLHAPSGALDLVKAADVVLGAWNRVKAANISCVGPLLRAGDRWMGFDNVHRLCQVLDEVLALVGGCFGVPC